MKKKQIILLSFWILQVFVVNMTVLGQYSATENISEGFRKIVSEHPQQKLFLHTDKQEYLAGENIWFKAYLVNAMTHEPDPRSHILHMSMTSHRGDIVTVELLKLNDGVTHGNIKLPDSLASGNYRLKLYTDWMMNFDEEFLYTKDIYVANPIEENFIRRSGRRRNRQFNRQLENKKEDMQFAFFPEGGRLIAGIQNKVAFKAANALGEGVQAVGAISNGKGEDITSFSTFHNGMGSFEFVPEPRKSYRAKVTFHDGQTTTLHLPQAYDAAYTLSAKLLGNDIVVEVVSNVDNGNIDDSGDHYFLAQMHGQIYYFDKVSIAKGRQATEISTDNMGTGICQLALLDADGRMVSERMVFINKNDIQEASLVSMEATPGGSEKQEISLELAMPDGKNGCYSVAIIDTGDKESGMPSMASEFFLFGDIDYLSKTPGIYLDPDSERSARAVDLVMMTHGWRRYSIEDMAAGKQPGIRYGFPEGISIRGVVKPRSSERKPGEVKVELAVYKEDKDILETANFYETRSDGDGNFIFTGLRYDGLFTAQLRADRSYDHRAMDLELVRREFEPDPYAMNIFSRERQTVSRGDDWERVPRPETVFEGRRFFKPGRHEGHSMYGQPDQVIYFDDIRDQYNTIFEVLRTRVRGLRVIDGEITLRGISSLVFSNEPVFMIDEVVVDRSAFLNVSVRQVDKLTVLTGPQTAILGSRGTNGALLIYTLRGDSRWDSTYEFVMQGFHEPAESFESKINTSKHADNNIDRSLFWDPMIETDGNNIRFSFPVDEHVRKMRLVLQGIDSEGRITFTDLFLNRP